MKSSIYNIFIDFPESKIRLAFNAFTLALVEFPLSDSAIIEKVLDDPNNPRKNNNKFKLVKEKLIQEGFLIEDYTDELQILKSKNRLSRFGHKNHLGLTIAPTLSCNFRCVYCYEKQRDDRMTAEIRPGLLKWVGEEVAEGKDLFVTWFGGEPLLALKEISHLTEGFMSAASRNKRRYEAHIVTNGYLLKRKIAEKLKSLGITSAQITLDGPKNIHDQRRALADGRGTFDTIIENIINVHDLIKIDLRINVDKNNASYASDVIDILAKEGLRNRVFPYFGHVYPYTDVCADIQSSCFRKEQFSLLETRLKLEMMNKGFYVSAYPNLKGGFCTADSLHTKVISPTGAIVKCWNDICSEEEKIGHILSRETTPKMYSNLCKWLAWDPFDKEKCRECQILPICMGGCPYVAFRKGLKDTGDCIDWKYNLKEMISLSHLQNRKIEEYEIAKALSDRIKHIKKGIRKEAGKKPDSRCSHPDHGTYDFDGLGD